MLLAIIAAVVSIIGYRRFAAADDSTVRLTFSPPAELRLTDFMIGGPVTISPDGERLAFAATDRAGTTSTPLGARSRVLGCAAAARHERRGPSVLVAGRSVSRLFCSAEAQNDSTHRRASSDALRRGPSAWRHVEQRGCDRFLPPALAATSIGTESGGTATAFPGDTLNPERHWPSFLPDGRRFVYFGRPRKHGVYVAAIDSPGARLLLSDHVGAAYAAPGYLLVLRGPSRGALPGALLSYPFDPVRAEIIGGPTPVAERIRYESALARGAFTVSGARVPRLRRHRQVHRRS